ncbi:ATP-binding protein [Gilvimarinus xylanilyticus]|uniref:histidine kinase n=1 Tax=Gilvimarinus xylanilyticus TaxID=2944139 RepID=A0A9X2I1B4_9GAMM|nr:ATP-binding protein [Gilvimarinus xylanilyticus]MCP8900316.1 ATP-binding protein [Gilvimarinus xylanilyticus]
MKPRPITLEQGYDPYQLLRVYTYYRVFLGALLLLIFESHALTNLLGSEHENVFFYTAWGYTILNTLQLVGLWFNHQPPSLQQKLSAILLDIFAITLLMFASGGATSGLGYLMIVSVAAAGMLLPTQLAIFTAALATLLLIGESVAHHAATGIDTKSLFVAGSLGALIFITAYTFQYLTKKIQISTAELKAQTEHIAHLQKLARLIVERMRTGIIVLNKNDDIELINEAAQSFLGLGSNQDLTLKLDQLPAIQSQLQQWRGSHDPHTGNQIIPPSAGNTTELKVSLANLELGKDEDTLVFIEDNRAIAQQAQQLKLASLGRLTASIAHEIRNPLSAISHASQLLGESPDINPADSRLLEIISHQTQRVNQIIENILHVSRRRPAEPATLELNAFMREFLSGDCEQASQVSLQSQTPSIYARFDPSQLQQILSNLISNALRYTDNSMHEPPVRIELGIEPRRDTPFLKVIDNGPGIAPENQRHIFEPFFTTESQGSGLGLFICKELCEANQAYIDYLCDEEQPSCFTLQFAHPDKVQK